MKTAIDYSECLYDEYSHDQVLTDCHIDHLHKLAEEGYYAARLYSDRINDVTGVSSSVDRATAF